MFRRVSSIGFLLVIITSVIFVLESTDLHTIYAKGGGKNVSLDEKINIKDVLRDLQSASTTLHNKIKIDDTIQVSRSNQSSVFETVAIKDQLAISIDNIKVKTKDNDKGDINGTITIKTRSDSLVAGASYLISPNPQTRVGNLLVTDGGNGDKDGLKNGLIKISQVHKGKYLIRQVAIPQGYFSLLGSTIKSINPAHLNKTATFRLVPSSTDLTQLDSTPISSPSLNDTAFNKWKSLSARIVSNSNSSEISDEDQSPQIILAGSKNLTAINNAINSITTISLNTTFASLSSGSKIIDMIGLENYSLPNSTSLVSVIPTIVANVNTTSGYVVATPPVSGIIPGQEMIIPVANSVIPSFGGLNKIDVQSSSSVNSGKEDTNWFVVEVDQKIPPSLGSKGIDFTPEFFVDIQHPFEEGGVGFNWSAPSDLALPPTITIIVNKSIQSSIQYDSAGCPYVDAYTLVSDSWTTFGVSEISARSISSLQCEITIQSQHLSKFAFSLKHLSSLGISQSLPGNGTVSDGNTQSNNHVADAVVQYTVQHVNKSSPPVGLTATASSTQITLHWAAPASNGGSVITGYKIERSTNGFTWYGITSNTGSTATTYSNARLEPNTTYTYRVSAINLAGPSAPSNTVSVTIHIVPSPPVRLTASASSTQITLHWAAPTSNGGAPITGYKIERSTNGFTWSAISSNSGSTSTIYHDTRIEPNTTYTYRVSAINLAGPSSPSNSAISFAPATPSENKPTPASKQTSIPSKPMSENKSTIPSKSIPASKPTPTPSKPTPVTKSSPVSKPTIPTVSKHATPK